METEAQQTFEAELAKLAGLTERLKATDLPLDQLAPLIDQAMAQAAVCERHLGAADREIAAQMKRYADMLSRLRYGRP